MPRNLLNPGAGAWFGAYPGGGNALPATYEGPTLANRTLDIVSRYEKLDGNWPSSSDQTLMAGGRYLAVCWSSQLSAGGSATWAAVAAGTYDTAITTRANALAALNMPVFVGYDNEMDGTTRIAASGPLTNYAAAFRHIYDIVAPIAPNVIWLWVPTGNNLNSGTAGAYPGDSCVDWICYDPYDATLSKGSPTATYTPFITWLNSQSFGSEKLIGIFETGIDNTVSDSGEAAWLSKVPACLQSLGISMWIWFNDSGSLGNTAITPGSASAAALASIGGMPFFNQPHGTVSTVTGEPYVIGSATNNLALATLVIPVSTTTSPGDAIVVGASANSLTNSVLSVTDSQGNTYSAGPSSSAEYSSSLWTALNTTQLVASTDTITVTYSSATLTAHNAGAIGCSSVLTVNAADISVSASNAASGSPSAASGAFQQTGELVIAWSDSGHAGGTIAWGTGIDPLISGVISASNQNSSLASYEPPSASSVTISGTLSTSTKWQLLALSLRGNAPAGTPGTVSLSGTGTLSVSASVIIVTPYAIGSATNNLAESTVVIPVSTTTVPGDAIVVGASANNLSDPPLTVTDTQGNTYVKYNPDSAQYSSAMFAALDTVRLVSGTDTITVTYSLTSLTAHNAGAIGCSSIGLVSAVDAQETASSAGSGSPSVSSGALAQATEILFAWSDSGHAGGTIAWNTGWTPLIVGVISVANQNSSMAVLQSPSSSSVIAGGTITSTKWQISVLSLRMMIPVRALASAQGSGLCSSHARQRPLLHAAGTAAAVPRGHLAGTVFPHGTAALSSAAAQGAPVVLLRGTFPGGTSGAVTVRSFPKIAGTSPGDIILFYCASANAGITWSCSGFTAVPAVSGTGGSAQILSRKADGTEGASFSVTASSAVSWAAVLSTYYSENLLVPLDAVTGSGTVNAVSTSVPAVPVITTQRGDLVIWFGFAAGTGALPSISLPPGLTLRAAQTSSSGSGIPVVAVISGDRLQAPAGSTGSSPGTLSAAAVNGAAIVAIAPLAAALAGAGTMGAAGTVRTNAVFRAVAVLSVRAVQRAHAAPAATGALTVAGAIRGTAALAAHGQLAAVPRAGGVILRAAGTLAVPGVQGAPAGLHAAAALSAAGRVPQVVTMAAAGSVSVTPRILYHSGMQGTAALVCTAAVRAPASMAAHGSAACSGLIRASVTMAARGAVMSPAARAAIAAQGTVTVHPALLARAVLQGSAVLTQGTRARVSLPAAGVLRAPVVQRATAVLAARGAVGLPVTLRVRPRLAGAAVLTSRAAQRAPVHLAGAGTARITVHERGVAHAAASGQLHVHGRIRSPARLAAASELSARGRYPGRAHLAGAGHMKARFILILQIFSMDPGGGASLSAVGTVISPVSQQVFGVRQYEIVNAALIPGPPGHDVPLDPRTGGRPVT